jgi:superfamily I DNA/RNA helicase
LVVECDGAAFHNSKKDENRDKELASAGYVTVRLPGLLIRTDPKRCLQLIDDGLSRLDLGSENLREHIPKLGSLSLNQQVATEHGLGPAMVLAPAGSGKTKVVTERVFNLVRSGAAAERIMCVSFTNTAVNEIRERFRKMAVERDLPQLLEVRVSTLNSLGSKICRDSIEYANLKILNKSRNPREKTQLQVLRTVLTKFSKDSKQREVFFAQSTEISEAISAYRQSLRVPSLDDHSLDLGLESEIERELLFRDIHSAYEKHLISIQMTDFDGQILNALRVLVSDRNKRIKFAREIDYWVVDEFQDLALPKMMMLRLLVAPARNVMVVGDDDQIIFGFAGARFELFEAFNQHWGDLETYLLNTNYRSNHEIVTRASWLISRNQLRVKKNIVPHSALDSEASVQVSYGLHYWEEVLDIILEERGKGTPLDQIGLLFRTTVSAAPVEKILREAKIPHNKLVKSSFFGSRTIQRLRSWMKIINKMADEADWVLALSWPEKYLSTNFINWLCDVEGDIEERLIAISEGALEIPFAVLKRTNQEEGMARDAISQFIYAVNNARKEGKDPVRQLMSLGFADIFSKDQVIEPINQKNPKLNKGLDGNSFSGLLAYQAFEDTLRTCKTYLEMERWISAAKSDPDIEWVSSDDDSNPKDQIKLSSIHAFKGKQLPVICVLGRGGSMPDYRAKEQEELEEERRVAYVAVTRAERRLFFCASEQYGAEMSVSEYGQSWEQYKSQAGGEKDENSPT